MISTAALTTEKARTLTILQRIAEKDKTAVADCIDVYGNFVWELAVKFTASREEAEAAVQEIFLDIWRFAERAAHPPTAEKLLIALIARRHLVKFLR